MMIKTKNLRLFLFFEFTGSVWVSLRIPRLFLLLYTRADNTNDCSVEEKRGERRAGKLCRGFMRHPRKSIYVKRFL